MRCGAFHRVEGTLCLVRHGQAALSGSKTKAPGFAGGYLLKPRLSATVRSYPYFVFLRRPLQAEFLKLFGPHLLQTAERGYPVIAVQNTQTSGNSYRNQGFFKCCIVRDVMERAVETPLGACIGRAARYLGQHLGHNGLRGLRELREAAV